MERQLNNATKEAVSIASFRYALGVEYTGTNYHGWQSQEAGISSIQQQIELALSKIANSPISIICAGRTDARVHATAQIIHFDSPVERDIRAWILGTNTHLPDDIAIQWAQPVSKKFHARFSALERRYRYLIYPNPVKPAVLPRGITWSYKNMDLELMKQGARYLIGEHDFTSYRAVGCQSHSPIRTLKQLDIYSSGQLIVLDVQANAFLHHMVRNIAGVLMAIGSKEKNPSWAKEVLDARDRRQGGVTAPPYGLYLVDVRYPSEFNLPSSKVGPYFIAE